MAGNGTATALGDGGPASRASVGFPFGMALDSAGALYFADSNRVRKISPDGIITTVAGGDGQTFGMFSPIGPVVVYSERPGRKMEVPMEDK